MFKLANSLKKWLTFDIPNRSSNLNNGNLFLVFVFCLIKAFFNGIGNMGNHLYCSSTKFSFSLFLQDRPIDLSSCHIGIFIKTLINKSFIMSKIQIRFCSIVRYIDFPMLNWIHGSWINVNIRVEFLHCHFIPSCF